MKGKGTGQEPSLESSNLFYPIGFSRQFSSKPPKARADGSIYERHIHSTHFKLYKYTLQ